MRKVEQSILAPHIVRSRVIPNGVDHSVFLPGNKQQARRVLGLPSDAHILLFVANRPNRNDFKDLSMIRRAAHQVASPLT